MAASDSDVAMKYFRQAEEELKIGNKAEAIKLYETALLADASVLAEDDQGMLDNLCKRYMADIVANQDDLKLRIKLAEIYAQAGKLEDAENLYKQIIEQFHEIAQHREDVEICRVALQEIKSKRQQISALTVKKEISKPEKKVGDESEKIKLKQYYQTKALEGKLPFQALLKANTKNISDVSESSKDKKRNSKVTEKKRELQKKITEKNKEIEKLNELLKAYRGMAAGYMHPAMVEVYNQHVGRYYVVVEERKKLLKELTELDSQ